MENVMGVHKTHGNIDVMIAKQDDAINWLWCVNQLEVVCF
jgi:hypothetical protein